MVHAPMPRSALAVSFAVVAGVIAAPPAAAIDPLLKVKNGIQYAAVSDNPAQGARVVGYVGSAEEIVIRDHIVAGGETYKVRLISDYAFEDNPNVTKVTLPESLRHIQAGAFDGSVVKKVVWPKRLKTIGFAAFRDTPMKKAILPDSVTSIESRAFYNSSLAVVELPSALTFAGESVFAGSDVDQLVVPKSLKKIGPIAFANMGLTKLTIQSGVKSIGDGAFSFNDLPAVKIPDSVRKIRSEAFADNDLTKPVVPVGVTFVGYSAFRNNEDLAFVRFKGLPLVEEPVELANEGTSIRYESAFDESVVPGGFTRGEGGWFGFDSFLYPEVTIKAPSKVKDGGKAKLRIVVRAGAAKISSGKVKVTFGGITKTIKFNAPFEERLFRIPNVSGSGKTYTAKAVYQGSPGQYLLKNKGTKKIKVVE